MPVKVSLPNLELAFPLCSHFVSGFSVELELLMEVALLLSAVDLKVVVIMVILLGVMMIKIETSAGPMTAAPMSRNPPTTERNNLYSLINQI